MPEIAQIKRLVPELEAPHDSRTQDALEAVANDLIAAIASRDPGFFSRFESDIESGSPLRVQMALHRAGVETVEAMAEMPEMEEGMRVLLDSPEVKERVAKESSELLDTDISVPDVDRMLQELVAGGGSQIVQNCLVLNLVVVINGAIYLNIVGVQNVGLAVAVVRYAAVTYEVDVPLPEAFELPGSTGHDGSLAFGKRLNAGRLAAERMVSDIARRFAVP